MANSLRLSRAQIAQIVGNDPEAIKQLERLFGVVDTTITGGQVDNAAIDAGTALAGVADLEGRLQALVDALGHEPPPRDLSALEGRMAALEALPVPPEPAAGLGALYLRTRAITASDNVRPDDYLLVCDATSGAVVVTLPAAAASHGREIIAKKTDASVNTVTVEGDGAETVDGAANKAITAQYDSVTVLCDGTAWWIV